MISRLRHQNDIRLIQTRKGKDLLSVQLLVMVCKRGRMNIVNNRTLRAKFSG